MKTEVRAKKQLGQHFLNDLTIAERIVNSLSGLCCNTLEIGPGMGVLTDFLIKKDNVNLVAVEIDKESVGYLHKYIPDLNVVEGDFLRMDLNNLFNNEKFSVIGNFPYNISSQIFFKILECRDRVSEIVCMLQKEVAERIVSAPTGREYGILSVFIQAFYTPEYLFEVGPNSFTPPPKVDSAVIRLKRNDRECLGCDEKLFKQVVKATFSQRRKTVRNSICSIYPFLKNVENKYYQLRPERLSVENFIELTNFVQEQNGLFNRSEGNN